jgi:hypothetical protein
LDRQVGWVILAIAGLALTVVTSISWLLVARRRIGQRRALYADQMLLVYTDSSQQLDDRNVLVATAAMTHYHLPSCQLVRGKSSRSDSLSSHQRAQRSPCAVCRP